MKRNTKRGREVVPRGCLVSLHQVHRASVLGLVRNHRVVRAFHITATEDILEFEVIELSTFIIRITRLRGTCASTDQPMRFMFGGSLLPKKEREFCDVALILPEGINESRGMASNFIAGLLSSLSRKPWQGLGIVASARSKSQWSSYQTQLCRSRCFTKKLSVLEVRPKNGRVFLQMADFLFGQSPA